MNTNKQEKIVCAAIRTIGTDGKCERCLISVGVDYHFIQEQEGYENIHDIESILSEVRGFITNKNRFVDPKKAMKIAVAACQVKNDFMLMSDPPQYRNLKPEDLD